MSAGPLADLAVTIAAPGRVRWTRELWRSKGALIGALFLLLVALAALFAPQLAPHPLGEIDLLDRLAKPAWGNGWSHPLGTDALGQDELTLLLHGARVSVSTGLIVVLIAGSVGTTLGLIAGYLGGWRGTLIMRLVDASIAFPGLLLALIVFTMVGAGQRTLVIFLSALSWMVFTRVTHDVVLGLKHRPFVRAAETVGCSPTRIVWRHLLPNLASPLLTVATLEFAAVVLAEASLSYLGFGIQPPDSSWGLMVADGQQYLSTAWWLVAIPGFAIALTVLSLNLLASWLRVAADPRQREKRLGDVRRAGHALETGPDPAPPATVSVVPVADPAQSLLHVSGLQVAFGTADGRQASAVRGVSFRLERGRTLALVGESGSGKTVTALALIGLVPKPGRVTTGEIRWQVPAPPAAAPRRLVGDRVTMVFQDPLASLNPLVPVGRQIGEVLRKHRGLSAAAARVKTIELLDLVGIPSAERRARQFPYELSGGMAQRIGIAMALAPEPDLIIADEPTTALDVTIQAQILELLQGLQRQFGMAILLIAHDLGMVAGMADRVAVMYAGRIVEEGPVAAIFARPQHPYTSALIACTPRLDRPRRGHMTSVGGSAPAATATLDGCSFAPRCIRATDRCRLELPPRDELGATHSYVCWHPLGSEQGAARGA
jgi:oligopeptide/dipeptide ABC transporter ATP-binding protein